MYAVKHVCFRRTLFDNESIIFAKAYQFSSSVALQSKLEEKILDRIICVTFLFRAKLSFICIVIDKSL